MKKSAAIILGSATLLLSFCLLWYLLAAGKESQTEGTGSKSADSPAPPATSSLVASRGEGPRRNVLLNQANHQPIEFYGRILDQHDAPVPGAEIQGRVTVNNGFVARIDQPTTRSDENGHFSFEGLVGRTLDFSVVKSGYLYTPATDAFDYTHLVSAAKRHHPDPGKPVIVRMWKMHGAEPLIAGGKSLRVVADGASVRMDFQTAALVESGGDVILRLRHPLWNRTSPTLPFDWTLEVEAVDGGAAWSGEKVEHMLFAPADGYAPSLSIHTQGIDPLWTNRTEKTFFLRSKSERYSRVALIVECTPKQPTSRVQLIWWQNPKGRNLEFDPDKQLSGK
jgi:hypothetical protein